MNWMENWTGYLQFAIPSFKKNEALNLLKIHSKMEEKCEYWVFKL